MRWTPQTYWIKRLDFLNTAQCAVLACTDGWPMLSLIVTTESLDALALRLSSWSVVDADGQYFVLRYADTRRLPDVVGSLLPSQHGAFFAPRGRMAVSRSCRAVGTVAVATVPRKPLTDVRFDGVQCARLIDSAT